MHYLIKKSRKFKTFNRVSSNFGHGSNLSEIAPVPAEARTRFVAMLTYQGYSKSNNLMEQPSSTNHSTY